jgi:hypothetical protein
VSLNDTVLWITAVGYFIFVAFVAALILVILQGRQLYRRGQISFDPVVAAVAFSVILVLLAIGIGWLG